MFACGFDGWHEIGGKAGLSEISTYACLDWQVRQHTGIMLGDDEDFDFWQLLVNASRGLYTIQVRHGNIHEDHIRPEIKGLFNRVPSIDCLAAHNPSRVRLQ